MQEFFSNVLILGLTTSAAYAIAAAGLVVTYSTSGIFNFSHGAISMLAAFSYWQVHESWGWPVWVSLIVVLGVVAPALGAGIEVVVMRGLQGASEVVRVVVTVSLMVAMLGLADVIWSAAAVSRRVTPFFPNQKVTIGEVNVTYHQIVTIAVALVVGVLLRLLLTRTRAGVAMRAVVDDRPLARLNGGKPDRSAMLAWAVGASMAALSGVLIASQKPIAPLALTLLVINAYAAAVVGRLRSLPMTVLGAVILGVVEATVGWYVPVDAQIGPFNLLGLKPAVPAIMLFVVLILLPHERLRAAGVHAQRERWGIPTLGFAVYGAVAFVVATAAIGSMLTATDILLLESGLWLGLVALSLVPLTGYAGQISLAQLSFAGIGALVMAIVAPSGNPLGVLVAVVVTAGIGALVALPAVRLTGIYLALATAAFALACSTLVFSQRELMPGDNRVVPRLDLGVARIDSDFSQSVLLAVAIGAVGVSLIWLRRGAYGRRLQALKDSPVACATLGMNITTTKVSVFAISAGIAGLAGALSGRTVQGQEFQLLASMPVTMLAVVGGIGSVAGAVLGGVMLGAILGVFDTLFAVNAIGWFSMFQISMTSITKLAPGFMGITLGRSPSGIIAEVSEGLKEVGSRANFLAAATAGEIVIWGLAVSGMLSNWWFAIATPVWLLGIVPLIPRIEEHTRKKQALAVSAVALLLTIVVPWESIDSNGLRVVIGGVILAVVVVAARRVAAIGMTDERVEPSPDRVGIDRPLTSSDVFDAEAGMGFGYGELAAAVVSGSATATATGTATATATATGTATAPATAGASAAGGGEGR